MHFSARTIRRSFSLQSGGRRLMWAGSSHHASASSSRNSDTRPATHDSPPSNNSGRELAYARTTGAGRQPAPRVEAKRAWTQHGAVPANARNQRPLLRSGRRRQHQPRAGSAGRARARSRSGGAYGARRVDCPPWLGVRPWPHIARASDWRDIGARWLLPQRRSGPVSARLRTVGALDMHAAKLGA